MMSTRAAGIGVVLVIVVSVAGTVFRVATTAPERVRQHHETARAACLVSNGEWVTLGKDVFCRAPAPKN